jgi:hypothetical protein
VDAVIAERTGDSRDDVPGFAAQPAVSGPTVGTLGWWTRICRLSASGLRTVGARSPLPSSVSAIGRTMALSCNPHFFVL